MSLKDELTLAPRMVESAYRFYEASNILASERNMMRISQINAALAIEILLKSFFSEVVKHPYEVYAKHSFNIKAAGKVKSSRDSHDLLLLAESLPDSVKAIILTESVKRRLQRYRNTFTKDRYQYETSADPGASTILTELAGTLIEQVVSLYRTVGCDDPWINCYPNV